MFVRNWTVVGKLFLLVASALLAGCASTRSMSEDSTHYEQAVFFALNNLDQGELTEWHNSATGSHGAVVIMASYPQGSGYCRKVNTQSYIKGKVQSYVRTACVNGVDTNWRFIR
jgi:surface antigen